MYSVHMNVNKIMKTTHVMSAKPTLNVQQEKKKGNNKHEEKLYYVHTVCGLEHREMQQTYSSIARGMQRTYTRRSKN